MKGAAIIGFGDVLQGDLGAGCYVLDALTQTLLDSPVELVYLADGYMYTTTAVFQKDLCIFMEALDLGCTLGTVQCWSLDAFRQNFSCPVVCHGSLQLLADALARAELAGGMPQKNNVCLVAARTDKRNRPIEESAQRIAGGDCAGV